MRLLSLLLGMLVAFSFTQSIKSQENYCTDFELTECAADDSEIQVSDSWDIFNFPFLANHSNYDFIFSSLNFVTLKSGINFMPYCNILRVLLFKQLKLSSH